MNKIPLEVGRVVRSKAGRDAGRLFLVVGEFDEDHLLIADGDLRKANRPKKKKKKHLSATARLLPDQAKAALLKDFEIRALLGDVKLSEEG